LNKKIIIYLDSAEEKFLKLNREALIGKKISQMIVDLLNSINKNFFSIIIKKHSREILSPNLIISKSCKLIKDPIPIELYNLKDVKCVIGFSSSGLAKVAEKNKNVRVISIARLQSSKLFDSKKVMQFINKLTSRNKVFYPKNFNELLNLINT